MPIHLPPLSRRKFLGRSLAAGAGLALAPRLLGDTRPRDPNSWALFADTHIAADRKLVANKVDLAGHFEEVTRELLALPKRPAGLFIAGDCAYARGEKGDYAHLTELLEPIRKDEIPVHIALGNHDARDHFWEALH
jgi:3',5'-cyclic AMP phosphodiesterase CpdA